MADLFDEFGNPLGDDDSSSDSADDAGQPAWLVDDADAMDADDADDAADDAAAAREPADVANAVVLHEDKQYYADAASVYPNAEGALRFPPM